MKNQVWALLLLLVPTIFGQVFQAQDPGASNSAQAVNSKAEEQLFLAALQGNAANCQVIRRYDYDNQPLGATTITEDFGRTTISAGGNLAPGSGVSNNPGSNTVGFPITDGQHFFIIPNTGVSTITWNFADPVRAFGSFFTGLNTAGGTTFTLTFTDGTTTVFNPTLTPVNAGGSIYFGWIAPAPFIKVVAASTNPGDIWSTDATTSAIFLGPIATSPVGTRFLQVLNLNTERSDQFTCQKGVTYDVAKGICACLGKTLADLTFNDYFNPAVSSALTGFETCNGRPILKSFWIRSYNTDTYGGAPLVLSFPAVTTQDPNTLREVLCNA
jgi:hypothetical protein